MIDLLFAEENIHKYKLDYNGYLVIVDKIRTTEVLNSLDLKAMQRHLLDLEVKYKNELNLIRKLEENKNTRHKNIFKLSKEQVSYELNYILKRLPAIGFIILGKGKEIGIDTFATSNPI